MSEPRTSQDLFNKVADIIDFTPEKYNQGVWGNAGTKYIGREDPTYIEWDNMSWEHDSLDVKSSDLKEDTRVDDACGTQACVAGWACLLSGFHPTMVEIELDEDSDKWAGSILNRVSSMFADAQKQLKEGGLRSIFTKKLGFNYNVMCDKPNVNTPINFDSISNRLLQMEDIPREGIEVDGNMFYRPDALGAELLNLDGGEAGTLFDGDYTWEADDLRMIGKGADIDDLLNEKHSENWCHNCDVEIEDCECDYAKLV